MAIPGLPRVELAQIPTPVDELESLGELLGVRLFVKRDDLTGCALTGNKVRKLEYVLGDAIEQDVDVVITCGGAQSNHARATALACRRLGIEPELFLRGAAGASSQVGNLFLDNLAGAHIHPVTPEEYGHREEIMARRREELAAEGRNGYVIPEGASCALGCLGYVDAMAEIVASEQEAEAPFDFLFAAVGSGGTMAGLLAGAQVHGFRGRILGVPVCDDGEFFRRKCERLLQQVQARYLPEVAVEVAADSFLDGFAGGGYAIASRQELERLRDIAILTGLVLDPVYTNKAFGAMLASIRDRIVPPDSRVLFLHTGGIHGLYAFAADVPV